MIGGAEADSLGRCHLKAAHSSAVSRLPSRCLSGTLAASVWDCSASEYFSVYFRNSIFFFTTVVFLEEQHLWRVRLTILCTAETTHQSWGRGPEVFEQKAAIPQGSLHTLLPGAAPINRAECELSVCLLRACKFVCVQSLPSWSSPEATTGQPLALRDTSACLYTFGWKSRHSFR